MDQEKYRNKIRNAVLARRSERSQALHKKQQFEKEENLQLGGDFADTTIEIVENEIAGIVAELPAQKQDTATRQMLRETKRGIMVAEQSNQAWIRANGKNQQGLNLAAGTMLDAFCNWVDDGLDRAYARSVVNEGLRPS